MYQPVPYVNEQKVWASDSVQICSSLNTVPSRLDPPRTRFNGTFTAQTEFISASKHTNTYGSWTSATKLQ